MRQIRNRLLAASALASLAAVPAAAQDTPGPPQSTADADQPAGDIVVTGSRGQARTVIDSPTPIDVVGTAELEKTGRPGVFAALNTLIPSFNVPTRAGGGTSTVITTGGLRGLNPDQTLVLVNGKRRHKTSLINAVSTFYNGSVPVDLDLIPSSGIERIEVLRDGAAAQYGSDAIAGVINLITKSAREGGEASVTVGQNFDRSDGETYLAQASIGLGLGADGFLQLYANGRKQERSNRAVPIATNILLYPLIGTRPDPREQTINRLVTRNYGAFPVEGINLGYNAGYDFGEVEFYSFGSFSRRDSELNFTYRAPNNTATLPQVYPDGFRPRLDISELDFEFAAGIKGDLGGWEYDISSTYGLNRSRQNGRDTLNPSLGPTSPTRFYVGALRSREWVNSLDLTRGYDVGGGNLQVSAGLQHRYERYEVVRGEPAAYAAGNYTYLVNGAVVRPAPGAQAAAGFQPSDEGDLKRNNFAGYLDVAWDPSPDTTIGVAGRYEHYDDASGDTLIGKLNARQALTDWVAIRAAVSTGFRAPGLAQQIYASTTGQFRTVAGALNLLQIKTLPVGSPAAIALGSEPLEPETSTNLSAGVVLTPASNLNLTIDAYQIKVKDRIAITSTLTGAAVSTILVRNGLSPDISAQYYTNAIDTRTRGIDVVATYRHNLNEYVRLSWNLGYNYNKTIITDIKANPPELASLGAGFVLFDRLSQSNLTVNLPRTKLFLGNTATQGPLSVNTRVVRYGDFKAFANPVVVGGVNTFPNDREFGAKWITDVEVAYQVTDNVQVALGANNLFNVYPDFNTAAANPALGSGFYATSGAYGFTGGYYYGRVRVSF